MDTDQCSEEGKKLLIEITRKYHTYSDVRTILNEAITVLNSAQNTQTIESVRYGS
jgi:hypothetical protein